MTIHQPRRGIALLFILVVLAVATVLFASISLQMLLNRKVLERRQHQLQAHWLARSGLAVAAARLHAGANYSGETLTLIPDSQVIVQVNGQSIVAEAKFPMSGDHHSLAKLEVRQQ